MTARKGIILAGGAGTRLHPITLAVSKQLIPVYDKPMIYYALSVLMLSGLREIAIITTPHDQAQFQNLLGDGAQWGIALTYVVQPAPDGLAQAYVLTEAFLNGAPSAMVLGDNIFFGHGLPDHLDAATQSQRATIFGYQVTDPERYGIVDFNADGTVRAVIEKPDVPPSNFAVAGLYFFDGSAPARAKQITPSPRGELEITSLIDSYLQDGLVDARLLGRGYAWLDTGTHGSLLAAGNLVETLQSRQGLLVGSPDEIAWRQGWIDDAGFEARCAIFHKSTYGQYLRTALKAPSVEPLESSFR